MSVELYEIDNLKKRKMIIVAEAYAIKLTLVIPNANHEIVILTTQASTEIAKPTKTTRQQAIDTPSQERRH